MEPLQFLKQRVGDKAMDVRSGSWAPRHPGLLISNIYVAIDTIDDTFVVLVSTILSCQGIGGSIDDTFMAVFSQYFDFDTFELI